MKIRIKNNEYNVKISPTYSICPIKVSSEENNSLPESVVVNALTFYSQATIPNSEKSVHRLDSYKGEGGGREGEKEQVRALGVCWGERDSVEEKVRNSQCLKGLLHIHSAVELGLVTPTYSKVG